MMIKINNILVKGISIIFLSIITFFTINSLFFTGTVDVNEETHYCVDNFLLNIVCLVFLIAIIVFFKKYIHLEFNKKTVNIINIIFLVIYSILLIYFINKARIFPVADQYEVLHSAEELFNKNFLHMKDYLDLYPHQNGIVLFVYFLKRISFLTNVVTSLNPYFMQRLNVIFLIIAFVFIEKIRKIFMCSCDKKYSGIIFLILFLPISFYVTFVYGTILGLMLSVISLYLELLYFIKSKKRYIFFSSIFICFAIVIKSNYLIFMIAEIIIILMHSICNKKAKDLLYIILFLALYLFSGKFVNFCISSITGSEVSSGIPKVSWISMGLQENENIASGWYNGYVYTTYIENGRDTDLTAEAVKEDLIIRLNEMCKNPIDTIVFLYDKISSQWNEPTFESVWIMTTSVVNGITQIDNENLNDFIFFKGTIYEIYVWYCNIIHLIILFGTLLYFIIDFKDLNYIKICFALIFIGGFAFHIFWEGKTQYTLPYFILLIPYAILGYDLFTKKIINKFEVKEEIKLIEA